MKTLFRITLILLTFALAAPMIYAESAADIQSRMKGRLSDVNELKTKGIIGENNKGYLEVLPGQTLTDKEVVDKENADRKKVYESIAKKEGSTADVVGQRRAAQIRAKAKKGHAIQAEDGTWSKKA